MESVPHPAEPAASWGEMGSCFANACGGLLLGLQACVVVPGLLPAVALGALLVLPFAVLGLVAAVVVGVPVAVVRLALHAARRSAKGGAAPRQRTRDDTRPSVAFPRTPRSSTIVPSK
jgi:hypothetical protein